MLVHDADKWLMICNHCHTNKTSLKVEAPTQKAICYYCQLLLICTISLFYRLKLPTKECERL